MNQEDYRVIFRPLIDAGNISEVVSKIRQLRHIPAQLDAIKRIYGNLSIYELETLDNINVFAHIHTWDFDPIFDAARECAEKVERVWEYADECPYPGSLVYELAYAEIRACTHLFKHQIEHALDMACVVDAELATAYVRGRVADSTRLIDLTIAEMGIVHTILNDMLRHIDNRPQPVNPRFKKFYYEPPDYD